MLTVSTHRCLAATNHLAFLTIHEAIRVATTATVDEWPALAQLNIVSPGKEVSQTSSALNWLTASIFET